MMTLENPMNRDMNRDSPDAMLSVMSRKRYYLRCAIEVLLDGQPSIRPDIETS
jgi:hypothetical protein